jgi:dethiobiotin synthetase
VGTDTGVGKTTIACALLAAARRRGRMPVACKPAETGAHPEPGDGLRLRAAAAHAELSLDEVSPFRFAAPVAPAAAAGATATPLLLPALVAAVTRVAARGDFAVVESAGGLLSPYGHDFTVADLAAALRLPVLLVARNALGTINHTALALAEIRRRALPLAGVILVDTSAAATPDRASNAELIAATTGVPPLGVMPFAPSLQPEDLADALSRAVDLDALFARLDRRTDSPRSTR